MQGHEPAGRQHVRKPANKARNLFARGDKPVDQTRVSMILILTGKHTAWMGLASNKAIIEQRCGAISGDTRMHERCGTTSNAK